MSEVVTTNTPLVSFIERAARDPEFDIAKFGELLRMQREVEHDQGRKAFNRAMAAAQSEMMPVIRTASNRHLGNKYAKLEDIDREMRPIYTAHGFSVRFGSAQAPREGDTRITCTVAHDAGYFEEHYLDAPASTTGSQGGKMAVTAVQAIGSVVTYLRRYLLTMVFNVVLADEDDDGEGMRGTAAAASTPRAPRRAEPAAPATNGNPATRTKEQWEAWLEKLRLGLGVVRTRAEVVEIGGKSTVGDALATAPDWVARDISAALAEAYGRFPDEPSTDAADPDAAGEPELPPVEIAGERYVGAG